MLCHTSAIEEVQANNLKTTVYLYCRVLDGRVDVIFISKKLVILTLKMYFTQLNIISIAARLVDGLRGFKTIHGPMFMHENSCSHVKKLYRS